MVKVFLAVSRSAFMRREDFYELSPRYPIFPKFYRRAFKRRFVQVGLLKFPDVCNIPDGVYAALLHGSRYFPNSIEGSFDLVSDIAQIIQDGVCAAFYPNRPAKIFGSVQYSGWRLCGVATW